MVAAVPLHRLAKVRLGTRAWLGAEPNAVLQNVEIEVDGELLPFGSLITLPIARNDYRAIPTSRSRRPTDVTVREGS